jgi:hypothetical protein
VELQKGKHDAFEIATLATAIVGVVILCIYTALTGYQALIAKDTAERQLRAYLSVKIEEQPDLDAPGAPRMVLLFRNNGQTPAFHVQAQASIFTAGQELTASDLKDTRDFLDKLPKSEIVLFPGQEFRESPAAGIPVTNDQRIAISMGAGVLWVVGEIAYIDAFGKQRATHFRLYMGGVAARQRKFVWANVGNDAD